MKKNLPKELEDILIFLKDLPGIGQRGAERILFSLLKWEPDKLRTFGLKIKNIPDNIRKCKICGNITDTDICNICSSDNRDDSVICIVESFIQIPIIESAGFKGRYHVIDGKLSPLSNIGVEALALPSLLTRLELNPTCKEIVIALNQDVEGQATTIFIADTLRKFNIKVSSLARGIPAGADISYANSATLSAALNGRISL